MTSRELTVVIAITVAAFGAGALAILVRDDYARAIRRARRARLRRLKG